MDVLNHKVHAPIKEARDAWGGDVIRVVGSDSYLLVNFYQTDRVNIHARSLRFGGEEIVPGNTKVEYYGRKDIQITLSRKL